MAAIALPPPQPVTAIIRSILDVEWTLPMPQGREGQCVRAAACEAANHWTARPSCVLETAQTEDQFTYDSVPLKVVGTMRVKYRFSGRLQPRPYRVD